MKTDIGRPWRGKYPSSNFSVQIVLNYRNAEAIDDLATSPISPSILASASEDHSLRLWNLSSEHENEPCVAILAGEGGHKAGVLAVVRIPLLSVRILRISEADVGRPSTPADDIYSLEDLTPA